MIPLGSKFGRFAVGAAILAEAEFLAATIFGALTEASALPMVVFVASTLFWPIFFLGCLFALPAEPKAIRPTRSRHYRNIARMLGLHAVIAVLQDLSKLPEPKLRPQVIAWIIVFGHVWALACWYFVLADPIASS